MDNLNCHNSVKDNQLATLVSKHRNLDFDSDEFVPLDDDFTSCNKREKQKLWALEHWNILFRNQIDHYFEERPVYNDP